jgi:hypothetical protein
LRISDSKVELEIERADPRKAEHPGTTAPLLPAFEYAAAVICNMLVQHEVFRSFTYSLDQGKFHTA